jgi:phosphohistidine phosphatase SixA
MKIPPRDCGTGFETYLVVTFIITIFILKDGYAGHLQRLALQTPFWMSGSSALLQILAKRRTFISEEQKMFTLSLLSLIRKPLKTINDMNVYATFILLLIFSASQLGCSSKQSPQDATSEQPTLVVFLVRHAEKADLTEDPQLSESGKERTLELAKILRSTKIEHIHSSDFIRTRETAAPVASEFGLTVEIYDPANLEALAHKIMDQGGNHLIVGHSNSTPKMVELLGGDQGTNINEAEEYDRLYIVNVSGNGSRSSILMRYGRPYYGKNGN